MNNNEIKIKIITDPKEQAAIKPELDKIKKAALEPIKFELDKEEIINFEKFKEKTWPRYLYSRKIYDWRMLYFFFYADWTRYKYLG